MTKDWNLNRFVILNGFYNFGQTNFFTFLTLFMRDAALASQPVASLCVGIAQASSAVARIGWGVVSDTLFGGRRKGLTVGLGAAAAVFLGLMVFVGPGSGVTLGLGLALLLARGLTLILFNVEPWDLTIFVTVTIALSLSGLAASFIPAKRATRVDPMEALRYE